MRLPVRFNSAVKNLLRELPEAAFVEVGPGNGLGTLLMQHAEAKEFAVVNSLNRGSEISEHNHFQEQLHSLISKGLTLDWDEIYSEEFQVKMILPPYAFDKKRCWLDVNMVTSQIEINAAKYPAAEPINAENNGKDLVKNNHLKQEFEAKIVQLLEQASGEKVDVGSFDLTYFEIGLDSLSMTQVASSIKKEFKVEVSFLQLYRELNSPNALLTYLLSNSELASVKQPSFSKNIEWPYTNGSNGDKGKDSLSRPAPSEDKLDEDGRTLISQPFEEIEKIKLHSAEFSDKALDRISESAPTVMDIDNPPFEGAKISLDKDGLPIWVSAEEHKKTKPSFFRFLF
jgi:acyl carrier protein